MSLGLRFGCQQGSRWCPHRLGGQREHTSICHWCPLATGTTPPALPAELLIIHLAEIAQHTNIDTEFAEKSHLY